MQQHLYNSENVLKSVIDSAPFPIGVYVGMELKIELANASMIKTYGKGDDVIGKLYTEILPELTNQEIFEQLREVLSTGISFHAKNKRVDIVIDGILKIHYFNYSFTPLFNAEGQVYGVMNTAAEVTDLNLARQQTIEAEEKLRLAVENADLGTYEIDLKGNVVKTSGKFKEIWDIDETVTQQHIIERLHPDDLWIRDKAYNEALTSGNISYEIRIIHSDSSIHWVRINGKFTFDEDGKPNTILGIVQDITEQIQSAEALSQLVTKRTEELQRSNEDLMQFAHIISHDLKEPVRKVKIFSGILKSEVGTAISETGNSHIDKIQNAADRMSLMVDGILKYSTINASGYPTEKIDLNDIIENIKSDLELVIQEKRAILIQDQLPVIEGSAILIHQLFYNLINNALKFSKAEEPPRVTIHSEIVKKEGQDYIKITIHDNGIGFDASHTEKMFTAFERLHSKDQYEGTGLGLALCKKIVDRHNGTIEAVGVIDEGADFIVSIPLRQPDKQLL